MTLITPLKEMPYLEFRVGSYTPPRTEHLYILIALRSLGEITARTSDHCTKYTI